MSAPALAAAAATLARPAAAVGIGIGATLFIDAWNALLARVAGVRSLDYCLLGRWVAHLPGGVFRHRAIAASPARRHECPLGLVAHFGIGVSLAVAFVYLVAPAWLERPTFPPALLYGIATVVFPLFVLQPLLGLGIASARSPHPALARVKSLATHTAFGTGIYVCGLVAARLLGA